MGQGNHDLIEKRGNMFDSISTGKYWDRPWSCISGCTPYSPGCEHCWSATITRRFRGGGYKQGSIWREPCLTDDKGHFNGKIITHPERLDIPLKRRKRTVFALWNDIMHEDVPFDFIKSAWEVMGNCPQHIFLILTKRAKRLPEIAHWLYRQENIKNIWLGVTVCNQQEADDKIPLLLQVPAAVHLISIEPMLGSIKLFDEENNSYDWTENGRDCLKPHIGWVILGGETGPGARPMQTKWVRSIRDQCQEAGIPFFFKSWGSKPPLEFREKNIGRLLDGREWNELPIEKGGE